MKEPVEDLNVLNTAEEANTEWNWIDLLRDRIDHVFKLVEHELECAFQLIEPKIRIVFGDSIDMTLQHDKVLLDFYETLELIHEDRIDFIPWITYVQEV